MKKAVFSLVFIFLSVFASMSQNNPATTGGCNVKVEQIELFNKTLLGLVIEKKVDVELLKNVRGNSKGYKFVPLIPFLPKIMPGVVININAEEGKAEASALKGTGGDIILNKRVERTYTGFLLVFWIEKIEVTGIAARIIK